MTIEIGRFGGGWKGRARTPREPYFVGPTAVEHAIDHPCQRARPSEGEIRLIEQNEAVIANILGALPA